ncbi:peptidoglycan editing factor PgeF [Pseudoalteromonas aliena]|uniref:peptidoglycan editing factor PgeF n=1 Tax=Pseudoalteromonas aliena TaxID=247523 RepID=UPI00311DA5BD
MNLLSAPWQRLDSVATLSTTREGGASKAPFSNMNLGLHVGDNKRHVLKNRTLLNSHLPNPAVWLNQTHSAEVVVVDEQFDFSILQDGDALFTTLINQPIAIMTADCLPILMTSSNGGEVAAIHGGWRGLEQGIIKNTLSYFKTNNENIYAWLGPAIGPTKFEVGIDVFDLFKAHSVLFTQAFQLQQNQKYLADIYLIARIQLQILGVKNISGGEYCTASQKELFFSYRRDGQTGRMASLIWRK